MLSLSDPNQPVPSPTELQALLFGGEPGQRELVRINGDALLAWSG
jgi:hypothetical protein